MNQPGSPPKPQDLPRLFAELRQLVVSYVRSRTLGPLRGLGRWVAFGFGGSIVLGAGVVLLLLAVLRALQSETGSTFTGHLSWLPYLITAGVGLGVIALAITQMLRRPGDHR